MFDAAAAADWVRTLRKAVVSAHTSLQRFSASSSAEKKKKKGVAVGQQQQQPRGPVPAAGSGSRALVSPKSPPVGSERRALFAASTVASGGGADTGSGSPLGSSGHGGMLRSRG
jgi:hypothetical protein